LVPYDEAWASLFPKIARFDQIATSSLWRGSTGYFTFQASKPPSRAAAWNPNLLSCRAARALVASSGQVQ
jgi:hypothetical protein